MSTTAIAALPTVNSPLPEEQKVPPMVLAKAAEVAKTLVLNPSKPESVLAIGAETQASSTKASSDLLDYVKVKDTGEVGKLLLSLSTHCKAVDTNKLAPGWRSKIANMPGIGHMFSSSQSFLGGYEDSIKMIDGIGNQLTQASHRILADVTSLNALYDQNLDFYRDLQKWIEVCRIKLEEMDTQIAGVQPSSPEEAQKLRDLQALRNSLDKRKHDLELTAMIRLQNAPKIRIIQAGSLALADKLQSSVVNTIPLWRDNLAIAITQVRQKEAVQLQDKVDDTTNALLKSSADLLHENSVAIAKSVNRGVVDIETLQYAQKQLLATIDDTQKIAAEGAQNRLKARADIETMTEELKQKALHS